MKWISEGEKSVWGRGGEEPDGERWASVDESYRHVHNLGVGGSGVSFADEWKRGRRGKKEYYRAINPK